MEQETEKCVPYMSSVRTHVRTHQLMFVILIRPCDVALIAYTYHTGSGLFSNKGIPKDLGQSAHAERNVITVLSQRPNAFLQTEETGSPDENNLKQNLNPQHPN